MAILTLFGWRSGPAAGVLRHPPPINNKVQTHANHRVYALWFAPAAAAAKATAHTFLTLSLTWKILGAMLQHSKNKIQQHANHGHMPMVLLGGGGSETGSIAFLAALLEVAPKKTYIFKR